MSKSRKVEMKAWREEEVKVYRGGGDKGVERGGGGCEGVERGGGGGESVHRGGCSEGVERRRMWGVQRGGGGGGEGVERRGGGGSEGVESGRTTHL